MARLRQNSVGRVSTKTNKLYIGVGHRYPVVMRKASLITLLMRRVWALPHVTSKSDLLMRRIWATRHQTGKPDNTLQQRTQGAEWLCACCSASTPGQSHQSPEKPMRVVNFFWVVIPAKRLMPSLCQACINLSYFYAKLPKYVRAYPSTLMKISPRYSLLLRLKVADTVLALRSFSFHLWRYEVIVSMYGLGVFSNIRQLNIECKIAKSSA